jgi:hypothetical protein
MFGMILAVMILNVFTAFTINALGQSSNLTLQDGQFSNNTQYRNQSEPQDQVLDEKIIKVSSTEFNQLLNEIKGSIDLIQDKKYSAAESKLGIAIIEILNSTQQYQELVQFASSQYVKKIDQQQFNDEET